MKTVKQTNPTTLPVQLAAIKDHLRIEDSENIYDADLVDLIRTATEWIEDNCHITLIEKEITCYFDSFPQTREFRLPLLPIQSIESITYVDTNGATQALSSYQEDLLDIPAKLYPAVGQSWPTTQSEKVNAVIIEVIAGYGANETHVPHLAKHLIKLLVGHWFKNREAVATGTISKEIEFSANELVKMLRRNEFEAFA
jgi:uncharacterized phiE125 gp8 family phage protein